MVASPLLTTQLRPLIAFCALVAGTASADADVKPRAGNTVRRLDLGEEGAATTVSIRGSATPTFTVYKLERPERVVVDVANAELATGAEGPQAANTWAVGQVSAQALHGQDSALVRVMVGFARPSAYRVKAVGNDVVVTVSALEARPAMPDVGQARA